MAEISVLDPREQEELASFLARSSFGGSLEYWRSRFRYWWDRNPAFSKDTPPGWVLKESGKIAGFLGNVPSLFQLDGRELTALATTSWVVDLSQRGRGLDLLFDQMQASRNSILFDATPTEEAAQIMRQLGFKPVPPENYRESLLITAPLLNSLQRLCLKSADAKFGVRQLDQADDSFDRLWKKTQGLYQNTNVRTKESVAWRAFKDDLLEKKLLGCYRGSELTGYMILKLRERKSLRTYECMDLWLDPGEEGALRALVHAAAAQKATLVTFPHFDRALGARLANLGLLSWRPVPRRRFMKAEDSILEEIREDNSYFVSLQGDSGTVLDTPGELRLIRTPG